MCTCVWVRVCVRVHASVCLFLRHRVNTLHYNCVRVTAREHVRVLTVTLSLTLRGKLRYRIHGYCVQQLQVQVRYGKQEGNM